MRNVLQQVSETTGVRVYGFFDDISLLGAPQQLTAALDHVQQSLPAVSLQLNTAKSHFTYFHDHLTPLTATVCRTLSANDIQLHHDWVGVVGAVVGRDDAAIRAGIHSTLTVAGNHDTFLAPSSAGRDAAPGCDDITQTVDGSGDELPSPLHCADVH